MKPTIRSLISDLNRLSREEQGIKKLSTHPLYFLRAYLISLLRSKEFLRLQSQEELFNSIFKETKFTIFILDACRYDFFKEVYKHFFNGCLKAVFSPASNTPDWLESIFGKYGRYLSNVTIFSGNPYINSMKVSVNGFNAKKYLKGIIVDVWKSRWNDELGTVTPEALVESVKNDELKNKNIIWFMQPHYPFINSNSRLRLLKNAYFVRQSLRNGIISRGYLSKLYKENLIRVFKAIKDILRLKRDKGGKWIITSDHGELLGEYNYYGHPIYLNLPEQRIVPWFTINE